jgi:AhpD family alkylhydroperoxidase
MEKPGNLTKAEREMIVVATSSSNQCQYCVVAHGAILRIRAKNPLISVAPHGERNCHAPER